MKTIYIRDVPEDLHRQVKAAAAMKGQNLNEFVLDLIRSALDGRKPPKK